MAAQNNKKLEDAQTELLAQKIGVDKAREVMDKTESSFPNSIDTSKKFYYFPPVPARYYSDRFKAWRLVGAGATWRSISWWPNWLIIFMTTTCLFYMFVAVWLVRAMVIEANTFFDLMSTEPRSTGVLLLGMIAIAYLGYYSIALIKFVRVIRNRLHTKKIDQL